MLEAITISVGIIVLAASIGRRWWRRRLVGARLRRLAKEAAAEAGDAEGAVRLRRASAPGRLYWRGPRVQIWKG